MRGDAELGVGPGVDLGAVGEQELDDLGVAAAGREGLVRVVGHVPVLLVGAARQQDLHHLVAAAGAGQGQGRVLGPLGLGLDVGAVVEQDLHDLLVAGGGGEDERGEALHVPVLDVGPRPSSPSPRRPG